MPYSSNADLPKPVRDALPSEAQAQWRAIFNSAYEKSQNDGTASATAWAGLKQAGWHKDEKGSWVKKAAGWDETDQYYRYRLKEPGTFEEGSFRTVDLSKTGKKIVSVMGKLKGETTMTMQNIMFSKEAGWTLADAKAWIADHSDVTKIGSFRLTVPISKINEEKRQVFGWANVSHEWKKDDAGNLVLKQVEDSQEDLVDVEDLESMAYRFTKLYREGGEMHVKKSSATMIESMVFTIEKQQALGIPAGMVPVGWWIGFEVSDDNAWEGVKKKLYTAFSIEGSARREEVK